MLPAEWETFIAQFAKLSRRQRLASMALLQDISPQQAVAALIERTPSAQVHCPVCLSSHIHRHGHAHGLQRYRCVFCRKTFNALTGMPGTDSARKAA